MWLNWYNLNLIWDNRDWFVFDVVNKIKIILMDLVINNICYKKLNWYGEIMSILIKIVRKINVVLKLLMIFNVIIIGKV